MIRDLFLGDYQPQPLSRFKAHATWLQQISSSRQRSLIIVAPLHDPAAVTGNLIADASILKPTVLAFTRNDQTVASLAEVKEHAHPLLEQVKTLRTFQGTFLGIEFVTVELRSGLCHHRLKPTSLGEISDALFRGKLVVAALTGQTSLKRQVFTECLARELNGLTTTFWPRPARH
jgi:hypothetical protein